MSNGSLTQRAAHGVKWAALAQWFQIVASFVVFTWLSRLLDPATFGLFALAMVVTAFNLILFNTAFREPIVQRPELGDDETQTMFWTSAVLGLVVGAASFLAAAPIAALFGEPALAPLVQVLSVKIVADALVSVPTGLRLRRFEFRSMGRQQIAVNILSGAGAIAIGVAGGGVWALVLQQVAIAVATLACNWVQSGFRPRLAWRYALLVPFLGFTGSVIASQGLTFLNQQFDRAVIGERLGTAALGLYASGRRLNELLIETTAGAIATVALPIYSAIQGDRARVSAAYLRTIRLLSFVSFPASLGLAAVAPTMVPLVLGPQWAGAVPIVQIFALTGIIRAIGTMQATALRSLGKPNWWLGYLVLQNAVNLVVLFVVTPYGIVPTAIALVVREYLIWPVSFFLVRKLLDLPARAYVGAFLGPLVASVTMAGGILARARFLDIPSAPAALAADLALGAVVYFGVSLALAPAVTRTTIGEFLRLARAAGGGGELSRAVPT
jgi:PST family polysaccharide transporter